MLHDHLIASLIIVSIIVSFAGLYSTRAYSLFYWLGLLFLEFYFLWSVFSGSQIYHGFTVFMTIFCVTSLLAQCFLNQFTDPTKVTANINFHGNISVLPSIFFYAISILIYFKGIGGIGNIVKSWIILRGDSSGQFYNIVSIFFYLLSMSSLAFIYKVTNKYKYILLAFILALGFAFLLRVKLYILPGLLPFIFIELFSSKHMLKKFFTGFTAITLLLVGYISTKLVRWLGNLEDINNIGQIQTRLDNVVGSGVEGEMVIQSQTIFVWGLNNSLYGQSYIKSFLAPMAQSVENPMHFYSIIMNGIDGGLLRGSVHPSIFSDAFANFGIIGALVPLLILVTLYILSSIFKTTSEKHYYFFVAILSISVPLIVRGSVYYGFLYLFLYSLSYVAVISLFRNTRFDLFISFKNRNDK